MTTQSWLFQYIFLIIFLVTTTPQLVSGKKCKVPPSKEVVEAGQFCLKKLGENASSSCAHVCVLEKFNVIEGERVKNQNWIHWVSKSFPENLHMEIVTALQDKCSNLYDPVRLNSFCDENDEFYHCVEDTVDAICEQ